MSLDEKIKQELRNGLAELDSKLAARDEELRKAKEERDELNEYLHEARAAIKAKSENIVHDIQWLIEERDELREKLETKLAPLCSHETDSVMKESGLYADLLKERDELKAEVALARERLGPAGYRILTEYSELKRKLGIAENGLENAWYDFERIEIANWDIYQAKLCAGSGSIRAKAALAAIREGGKK